MKLKRYQIHEQHFINQFIRGHEIKGRKVIENGIPETARIYDVRYFPSRRTVELWVEDDSFPEIDGTNIVQEFVIVQEFG